VMFTIKWNSRRDAILLTLLGGFAALVLEKLAVRLLSLGSAGTERGKNSREEGAGKEAKGKAPRRIWQIQGVEDEVDTDDDMPSTPALGMQRSRSIAEKVSPDRWRPRSPLPSPTRRLPALAAIPPLSLDGGEDLPQPAELRDHSSSTSTAYRQVVEEVSQTASARLEEQLQEPQFEDSRQPPLPGKLVERRPSSPGRVVLPPPEIQAVRSDQRVVGWGCNGDKQLLLTELHEKLPLPGPIGHLAGRVVMVSCGSRHSLALTSDGQVFAWGWNALGQLGIPVDASDPVLSMRTPIVALDVARADEGAVVEIAAGGMHSAARFTSGHVYSWGMSRFGQLGLGPEAVADKVVATPGMVRLASLTEGVGNGTVGKPLVARQLSCGGMHTAALSMTGEVYCWGRADSGQLGIGRRWITNPVSGRDGSYIDTSLCLSGMHSPELVENFVASDDHVVQVACGAFHTMAATKQGKLFSWGKEESGCLGIHFTGESLLSGVYQPHEVQLPPGISVARVSCGGAHSLVLSTDGRVLACGKNENGRLGLPNEKNQLTFCELPVFSAPSQGGGMGKVVMVACGGAHSLFLTDEGKVYASGRGSQGRLGSGSEKQALEPILVSMPFHPTGAHPAFVSAGGQHSLAVYAGAQGGAECGEA